MRRSQLRYFASPLQVHHDHRIRALRQRNAAARHGAQDGGPHPRGGQPRKPDFQNDAAGKGDARLRPGDDLPFRGRWRRQGRVGGKAAGTGKLSRAIFPRQRHPAAGPCALSQEHAAHHLRCQRRPRSCPAGCRCLRRAARSVLRASAQRLAHPLRISPQHGCRRFHVHFGDCRRGPVGPHRLSSLFPARADHAGPDRRGNVRGIFLHASAGPETEAQARYRQPRPCRARPFPAACRASRQY
ncbi:hypothetical protein D3C86_1193740 [compost metagenome]